ncbi:MAG TPA: PKD domain-containing protein [Bacteroidales bacterium]|nr:PKD domain-containing protein [Bacteroidales bacterium]
MKRLIFLTAIAALVLTSCDIQPDANFFTDKVIAEVGEEIYFTNASYNATDFEWDFGDGTISDAFNAIHTYSGTGIFTVVLRVWSHTGNLDEAYQEIEVLSPTMLEVEVLEYWDQYPVRNASVILYPTLQDWDNETNAIVEGFTNSSGKVIFTNLGPRVYCVDVWHQDYNNYTLRDEDVEFIQTDRLNARELNQFTAWVDYTGAKGASATRDRKMLVVPKDRTMNQTVKK